MILFNCLSFLKCFLFASCMTLHYPDFPPPVFHAVSCPPVNILPIPLRQVSRLHPHSAYFSSYVKYVPLISPFHGLICHFFADNFQNYIQPSLLCWNSDAQTHVLARYLQRDMQESLKMHMVRVYSSSHTLSRPAENPSTFSWLSEFLWLSKWYLKLSQFFKTETYVCIYCVCMCVQIKSAIYRKVFSNIISL